MCKLNPVTFHGDTIFCIDYCGEPYTPMKPIVENMGLGWASQTQKLNANKERWGVTIIVTPTDGGEQETLCMPVRKLPAYLNTINPKKVKIAIRDRVILYQNESDDALWDYWTKGRAESSILTPSHSPHNQSYHHSTHQSRPISSARCNHLSRLVLTPYRKRSAPTPSILRSGDDSRTISGSLSTTNCHRRALPKPLSI